MCVSKCVNVYCKVNIKTGEMCLFRVSNILNSIKPDQKTDGYVYPHNSEV